MSDPRKALVQAMLSYDANGIQEAPSARAWAEHVADAVLREFLVMPRGKAIRWTAKAPGITLTCYRVLPDGP